MTFTLRPSLQCACLAVMLGPIASADETLFNDQDHSVWVSALVKADLDPTAPLPPDSVLVSIIAPEVQKADVSRSRPASRNFELPYLKGESRSIELPAGHTIAFCGMKPWRSNLAHFQMTPYPPDQLPTHRGVAYHLSYHMSVGQDSTAVHCVFRSVDHGSVSQAFSPSGSYQDSEADVAPEGNPEGCVCVIL